MAASDRKNGRNVTSSVLFCSLSLSLCACPLHLIFKFRFFCPSRWLLTDSMSDVCNMSAQASHKTAKHSFVNHSLDCNSVVIIRLWEHSLTNNTSVSYCVIQALPALDGRWLIICPSTPVLPRGDNGDDLDEKNRSPSQIYISNVIYLC